MRDEPLPALPPRDARGHKGTFGTVCVVGGQAVAPTVMIGGPALTAEAALRAGAGLAMLAVPAPLMGTALTIVPSATGLALPVDDAGALRPSEVAAVLDDARPRIEVLAVGPGWGHAFPQQQVLVRLLADERTPIVLDADGLNAFSELAGVQRDVQAPLIITPHPGEMRRLADALEMSVDLRSPAGRADATDDLARRLGCVVVLKGAGTVVSDGHRRRVNHTGNAALATAGTGDVLTGVIAGLVAQHFNRTEPELDLWSCAALGVWLHGRAADLWCEQRGEAGLLARELSNILPDVIDAYRRSDA